MKLILALYCNFKVHEVCHSSMFLFACGFEGGIQTTTGYQSIEWILDVLLSFLSYGTKIQWVGSSVGWSVISKF